MSRTVPGPGWKALLALSSLLCPYLLNPTTATPQTRGPQKKVAHSPRIVSSSRSDLSPALRDIPPRPPTRDQVEREMHKPRPLRGRPGNGIGKPTRDPVVQKTPQGAAMPSTQQNFEGIGNVNGVLPPDTNGAVGPNHYVQWVNLSFAVYDKTGTLLYGPADGSTIWSGFGGYCELTNNGDPVVMHDDLADRWVMSQLALPFFPFGPFYQCVAVSQTADPTGAYYRYEFAISETKLNDYPKLGVWPDAYYLAVNQFDVLTSAFLGQGVVALERDQLLAGLPARMVYFDLFSVDPNLGGMLPSHADGTAPAPGSPNIFVQVDDDGLGQAPQDQLQLWEFHVDWTNPAASTFSGPTPLATAPFDSNLCGYARNCIAQRGTNRRVDAISDRLMYRLQYRNFGSHEALVVNHTVDVGADQAGVRWYEIWDPLGTPVIYQQGTYAPDGDHRWMGSIAMDGVGNLALGYSVSGKNTYPSIRYAGRLAGDPLGVLAQGETELVAGSGSQTDSTGRWGDYSSMSVDPTDHCTFWYTQEYYAITSRSNWQTRIGSFSFPSCASNLPSVTVLATTPNANEDGASTGLLSFSRTGSSSSALQVNFAVTGTATPGSDYTGLPSQITIPAGAGTATLPVTALDDFQVEGNETVIVTLRPDPGYTTGTPSSAIVYVISDDLPPDLLVTTLSAPPAAGAGQNITISDTTKNQGGGLANPSTTRFYLSADTVPDAADIVLGARSVPPLAPGNNDSASTSITIPAGTAGGAYYILAQADADDANAETQESNNSNYSFVQIGPDLTITALTVPATAGAGSSLAVTDTTKNQGSGTAGASTTRFYLSTNSVLDASDTALGERSVPALGPGVSSSGSTTVMIPGSTGAGTYYVLARADADKTVSETQEANNGNYGFVQIGPDLTITALSAPSTSGAGAAVTITDTTKNQGGGSAGASNTRYYLSTNSILDASDLALGARTVPMLAPGAVSSGSATVTIPAGTAGGTYYLLARADADDVVPETQELNNGNYAFIQIGPDLIVSALSTPSTTGAGSNVLVTDTTKNQGGGAAAASTTRFYLSINPVLDAGDVALGARSIPALAASGSSSGSTTVTIPAGTAAGTYYVLARADADNVVSETQELNNGNYAFLQVGPDLTISAVTAPTTASAGATITVSDTTKNQGGGAAAASTTRFYLSTNTILDVGDVTLGARAIPALAPGLTSSGSTAVTIPAGTGGGTYYILVRADADDTVAETQELNNGSYSSLQIGPDLTIAAFTAPATASAGSTFSVSDTTRNQGGGAASASTTRFYLSTNTVFDANDVALGGRSIPALSPGASSFGSSSVTIPAGTADGSYYLLAKADADEVVAEIQEFNNVYYVSLQIGPDLTVTAMSAPASAGAGSVITVNDTTRNQGGGTAGASTTRFYLSTNTLVDASDVVLGARSVPALGPGATSSASTSVTIPAGTANGAYYLLAAADADNVVVETLEFNNVRYSYLQIGADLAVTSLTVPTATGPGATITVSDTTRNQGGGTADPSTTAFYLSTNTVFDASDVLLGSRAIPALTSGVSNSGSTSLTIPTGTSVGLYYVLARADANDVVVETQENNNYNFAYTQIGPDLVLWALTAPTSAAAGTSITTSDTTRNQGGGSASPSTTRFYLSTDSVFDAGDIPLGSRAIPTLGPGLMDSGTTAVTIPSGTPAGTYYILGLSDADNSVAETQELNNRRHTFISVTVN